MFYVYVLQSVATGATYVGYSADWKTRIADHNSGKCTHTAKFRPWKLIAYVAVEDQSVAIDLERYFKTGSGKAFWKKRLIKVPEGPPKPLA